MEQTKTKAELLKEKADALKAAYDAAVAEVEAEVNADLITALQAVHDLLKSKHADLPHYKWQPTGAAIGDFKIIITKLAAPSSAVGATGTTSKAARAVRCSKGAQSFEFRSVSAAVKSLVIPNPTSAFNADAGKRYLEKAGYEVSFIETATATPDAGTPDAVIPAPDTE